MAKHSDDEWRSKAALILLLLMLLLLLEKCSKSMSKSRSNSVYGTMANIGGINKAEIRTLIPHSGLMCLLDEVTQWDDRSITCITNTHRDPANPLRRDGRLSALHAFEYGAQAAAVHGGLRARLVNACTRRSSMSSSPHCKYAPCVYSEMVLIAFTNATSPRLTRSSLKAGLQSFSAIGK